jgi:aryl-alcohol dehydrogenase-like predicted oxidoreductase
MVPRLLFGNTGHESSRLIFGAAALGSVTQAEADTAMERLLEAGLNHIDTAAAYGDSELRIGPWMERHRSEFFLATKTGERSYAGARDSLRRSLERLRVDHVDLLQFHNLVKPDEWEEAMGGDGALRAAIEAREEGLVRFIGVSGHGTRVAAMHLRSLERFDFDSVLLPYNFAMMQSAEYAQDFERLLETCRERNVAVQTIKCVARRRWPEGATPTHSTWYEPFEDPVDIERAVHWSLSRPAIFVNSASDLGILWHMLRAAESFKERPPESEMREHARRLAVEPLFIRGFSAEA